MSRSSWCQPPVWLEEPVVGVMADLQAATPIRGLVPAASFEDGLNGVSLGVIEPSELSATLPRLPDAADELDPEPAGSPGGGNFIPRGLTEPGLLARVAEILQEDLAETEIAWGQARPPCPYHPHPARPVVRDGEAWWICERLSEPLYRIGRGEVPTRRGPAPTWAASESRRARNAGADEDADIVGTSRRTLPLRRPSSHGPVASAPADRRRRAAAGRASNLPAKGSGNS